MSLTATEIPLSDERQTDKEQVPSAARRFRVHPQATDTTGVESAIHALSIVSAVYSVDLFTAHPHDPKLRAKNYDVQPVRDAGGRQCYDVIWFYEVLPPISIEPPEGPGPGEVGYTELSWAAQGLFIDSWRSYGSVSLPGPTEIDAPPLVEDADSNDIGGLPIDSGGEPTSYPITVITAQIKQVVSNIQALKRSATLVNHRNSAEFLGATAGKLLYKGSTASRLSESSLEVIHEFVWDEFYHLRQYVKKEHDGKPSIGDSSATSSLPNQSVSLFGRAYPVGWVQPFFATEDFNILNLQVF